MIQSGARPGSHDQQQRLQLRFETQIFDVTPQTGGRAVMAGADQVRWDPRREVVDVVILHSPHTTLQNAGRGAN